MYLAAVALMLLLYTLSDSLHYIGYLMKPHAHVLVPPVAFFEVKSWLNSGNIDEVKRDDEGLLKNSGLFLVNFSKRATGHL